MFTKYYNKGYEDGYNARRNLVSLMDEEEFMLSETKLPPEMVEVLKTIINSESYDHLRRYLLRQALSLYREARRTGKERLNDIGNFICDNIIADMDMLKSEPESLSEPDPYDHNS